MKYDIDLDIATGLKRTQKIYKNASWPWSKLVDKLKITVRTPETVSDYLKLPKSQQDDIKDVGGFVGGYLVKGSRTQVKHRQLVCLDIDYGNMDIWEFYKLIYDNAALIYSTHKHVPKSPRLRLLVPLDRKVTLDEYQAIARKIADTLDINAFDDTTYQPQRMMYWPSTSSDGEYICQVSDGPILEADSVLCEYEDWTDVTSWPTSERTSSAVARSIKKQKDPLEKPGLVGAFCRAYGIHEAIETFIKDYTSCDIENRYTYTKGSTSAGIITYDDKFSYSHHATDPTSGQLCNAFDLVRLHKYADLDEDMKPDTPANRMPSYKAMCELAQDDPQVKKMLVSTMFDSEDEEDEESLDWVKELEFERNGKIRTSINNACLIIENDKGLKGIFAFNEFSRKSIALRALPWRKINSANNTLLDSDDAEMRRYLEDKYQFIGRACIDDALTCVAMKNSFHPVKDYLNSLEWDGIERLDSLFIDYLGASDDAYTRAVARKTFTAAVKRAFVPGCKFDTMCVLVGIQGVGKSYFLSRMAVKASWFNDTITTVKGKEAFEALQGYWIIEMAELTAARKSEIEAVKQFISSTSDNYRKAYGKRIENNPRQCVMFGTTNDDEFLRDYTGNRRFLPIRVDKNRITKNMFNDLDDEELAQIWAEAKYRYECNEPLYLEKDVLEQAMKIQKEHTASSPYEGIVKEALEQKVPKDWLQRNKSRRNEYIGGFGFEEKSLTLVDRDRVCLLEIWEEILGNRNRMTSADKAEIRNVMASVDGWVKNPNAYRYGCYGVQRNGYVKL